MTHAGKDTDAQQGLLQVNPLFYPKTDSLPGESIYIASLLDV
jgi:hypothetical protein